jgi:glycosyltransferase involved in cell wall biosynthesis
VARVSVVMTAHNEAPLIGEAVASILAQTFTDFELIVVDDGSTDGTADVVERFGDPRVRVVRQANTGQPRAMNRGIREARGDLVARHDADDLSLPERFGRQVAFLDAHPDVALVGTGALLRNAAGRDRVFHAVPSSQGVRRALAWGNPIVHTSVMMRRAAVEQAGAYADMQFEDYDLWIRMAAAFPLANIAAPLVVRRVRAGSRGRAGRRSAALALKARLQRTAIERLRLPAPAWVALVPTLAAANAFAALEWAGDLLAGRAEKRARAGGRERTDPPARADRRA